MGKQLASGYCAWCAENTDHGHYSKSALEGLGHLLIRMVAGSSGYGPWYCSGCRRVASMIMPPMDERSGSSIDDAIIHQRSQAARGMVCVSQDDIPQASDSRRPLVQADQCRYSKARHSSSRYSQKYRFAVARRIIEGQATFKQIGAELSISKYEIWSWLVEHFRDNQHQIAQLKKQMGLVEGVTATATATPRVKADDQVVSVDADADRSWLTTVVVVGQQVDNR